MDQKSTSMKAYLLSDRMLLFDPQTSGGLLLAVPKHIKNEFLGKAKDTEQPAWVIGNVVEGSGLEVIQ